MGKNKKIRKVAWSLKNKEKPEALLTASGFSLWLLFNQAHCNK